MSEITDRRREAVSGYSPPNQRHQGAGCFSYVPIHPDDCGWVSVIRWGETS